MKKTTVGLILMGVGITFSIWSAGMPSAMSIGKFGFREGTPEDRRDLAIGATVSLSAIAVMWIGLYLLIKGNE